MTEEQLRQWQEKFLEQRAQVRLLIDENLPPSLTRHLADIFPGSKHVRDVELARSPDTSIWDHAKRFDFAILTKDVDFASRVREEGAPPVIIQIRVGNCSVSRLISILFENATQIKTTVQYGGPLLEIGLARAASTPETPE